MRTKSHLALQFAYSPCPNDVFVFSAWTQGLLESTPAVTALSTDIQSLNELALSGRVDLCKVSAAIVADLHDEYCLLPVGAALSYGAGPKLIATTPMSLSDISAEVVASPGIHTMADRILRTLVNPREILPLRFNEVIPAMLAGRVRAGVVIHESRFAVEEHGLYEVCDLGELWQTKLRLPLPLGALVAKRSLGEARIAEVIKTVQRSIHYARSNCDALMPLIKAQSSEQDDDVLKRHIALFANEDTFELSEQGKKAFAALRVTSVE